MVVVEMRCVDLNGDFGWVIMIMLFIFDLLDGG